MSQQPSSLDRARRNAIAEAALTIWDEYGPPRGEERAHSNDIFSRVLHSGTVNDVAEQYGILGGAPPQEGLVSDSSAAWLTVGEPDDISTEISYTVPGSPPPANRPLPPSAFGLESAAASNGDGLGFLRGPCRTCGEANPNHPGGRCPLLGQPTGRSAATANQVPPSSVGPPLVLDVSAGRRVVHRASGAIPTLAPAANDPPPPNQQASTRVDAYGNRVAEVAEYLLLRSKPGFARPGLYGGTWSEFSSLFPINPRTLKRLPQNGFHFRKAESRQQAQVFWTAHGHEGAPPFFGTYPYQQQPAP